MRFSATLICLWLAVLVAGISVGGNLFQMMVIDPVWSASPPESEHAFFGGTEFGARLARFHTNPALVIGLVALLAAPFLAWNAPGLRKWLLLAVALEAVIVLGTIFYVWPINKVLIEQAGGVDRVAAIALTHRWLLADRIRFVLKIAVLLCLLRSMNLAGAVMKAR